LAQGLISAEEFLDGCASALVLAGTNIFYGHNLPKMMAAELIARPSRRAPLFGYSRGEPCALNGLVDSLRHGPARFPLF